MQDMKDTDDKGMTFEEKLRRLEKSPLRIQPVFMSEDTFRDIAEWAQGTWSPATRDNTRTGVFARPTLSVWRDYCLRMSQEFTEPSMQPVVVAPTSGMYAGFAMLAYPTWWFRLSELEVRDE